MKVENFHPSFLLLNLPAFW